MATAAGGKGRPLDKGKGGENWEGRGAIMERDTVTTGFGELQSDSRLQTKEPSLGVKLTSMTLRM